MTKWHVFHYVWLILASYGVWFAIVSGLEEMSNGKVWKAILCAVLGFISYLLIEYVIAPNESR